ncbi:Zinc finger FYVE domain-containing protein 16 [Chelonia mydas]|uniref:Zinc finger FYVE domain-containing protein 16 n=1 Tax=Chelonia mydas TaxID=8469 RepID=M7BGG6_CHEMY|nr:Zinc finger FYVE domain-containing protein 16 [Chelonia mydas]
MDNYFKAAVCDLDKLLDEFEQNTDELDCYRTAANQCDSIQHSVSSELDCLQPVFLIPKVQEYVSSCSMSEEFSLASQAITNTAKFELNSSAQNEKNVTGLDLLSTVDGGASNEIQPLSLGRCSIPVCDLISDTGNLIHSTSNHEDIEKLQPDDFQCNENSLVGFDLSLVPATVCSLSVAFSGVSGTEQQNGGDTTPQDAGHVATKELSQLDFKTHNRGKAKLSDSCDGQNRTETLKDIQIFDQLEQITGLNATSAFVTSQSPKALSSKDDTTIEKLPCESLKDESQCCMISQEAPEESVNDSVDSKDDGNGESLPSDLPKSSELHKNSLKLSGKCVIPDSSSQIEDRVVLDKMKSAEENMCSPELNTNEILHSVSNSHVTAEDIQTSLSCLPLAVSICGSLVVTEDKSDHIPQNEKADVISDTVTMHAGKSKHGFPSMESSGKMKPSEQEGYLNQINQCFVEEAITIDGKKRESDNKINKGDSPQMHAAAAGPVGEAKIELCSDGIQPVDSHDQSITCPVLADLTIEEYLIESDSLISDAELDAFLSGQSLQPNNSQPFEEGMDDLLEPDANQANNLDFRKVNDSQTKAKLEEIGEISSINSTCRIADIEYKLESPPEKSTYPIQQEASNHITETRIEVPVPTLSHQNVHIGGARPKQLLNLSQRTVIEREFSKPDMPRTEFQEVNSLPPKASLSETKTSTDISSKCNPSDTENSLEAGGSCVPASVELGKEPLVLGLKQPPWVPDSEAPNCMNCQVKFTFTKRRHHCRACGKVFCGVCCNRKCKLQYTEKEARVCIGCYKSINKAQAFERMMSPTGTIPNSSVSSEYCSTVPPLQEAQTVGTPNSPSSSLLLPISVLKQPGADGLCAREQRRVWFADGILPNGEVADTTKLSSGVKKSSQELSPASPVASPADDICVTDTKPKDEIAVSAGTEKFHCSLHVAPDDDQLPTAVQTEMLHSLDSLIPAADELPFITKVEKSPSLGTVNQTNDDSLVSPSDYRMLCGIENCVSKEFSLIPDDDGLPPLLLATGEKGKGKYIGNLENFTFTESFLGSKDHGGFLFVAPTFQKLDDLLLPNNPFLCGILIQKLEIPWAKVFPIRLMLGLGAEYGAYPTPVTSIRHRKPLFGEIGHTIMNLLVVMKVIHSSNEHVISIGASFSTEADSHLVCVQSDGVYQTQANSATGHPRRITGASFVVFNGALKTSSGFLAKSSIVEDGLMVQITPETMEGLRQALRDKKDFKITCGKMDAEELKEYVDICWVESEEKVNQGVVSPVDGKSMEGIQSERILQGDFDTEEKLMKCTEVFYILKDHELSSATPHQFAKEIAVACSAALCPHLKTLKNNGMNKIGLRISTDTDMEQPLFRGESRILAPRGPGRIESRPQEAGLSRQDPRPPPPAMERELVAMVRTYLKLFFMYAVLTLNIIDIGAWSENVLDYFLNTNQIKTRDGAEIIWYHAANNRSQMKEAIQSAAHMVEADILLCGEEEGNGEPIMAHPPETNSDNTLQTWLNEIVNTKKGIKLDFKSQGQSYISRSASMVSVSFGTPPTPSTPEILTVTQLTCIPDEAVASTSTAPALEDSRVLQQLLSLAAVKPSMKLLEGIKLHLRRPVWINADILPGPNGSNTVVDAKRFLDTVTSFCPDVTLSLSWTTGWQPQQCNKGYSWAMVKEMAQICDALTQPVTFPVRAALVRQSKSELLWLLQKSNRYSLTVWTGMHDEYSIEDLLYLRENFDKSRVYYDILEPQNSEFRKAIGIEV